MYPLYGDPDEKMWTPVSISEFFGNRHHLFLKSASPPHSGKRRAKKCYRRAALFLDRLHVRCTIHCCRCFVLLELVVRKWNTPRMHNQRHYADYKCSELLSENTDFTVVAQ